MAHSSEPTAPLGEPHNARFETHHALEPGSVAKHLRSSAPSSQLKRSNATRKKHPNAGHFGTAGVSGIRKQSRVKERHPMTFGTAGVSGLQRRNAVRERHANAGYFGTAGVSGLSRTDGPKKQRVGKAGQVERSKEPVVRGTLGSFSSGGRRRSSRVAGIGPETSPTFDQFEDPPM